MERLKSILKISWLQITRAFRHVFENFGVKLSILLVVFSLLISVFFLVPSMFNRMPVFSYFINTLELPISYEYEGNIILLDKNGNNIDQNVAVYIGGNSTYTDSQKDFTIIFSSVDTEYMFVNVEYKDLNGNLSIFTQKIDTHGKTTIKKDITIYV